MDYVNGNREEGLYQIYKSNLRKSVEENKKLKEHMNRNWLKILRKIVKVSSLT